jgi:hypothetical protein
MNARKHQLAAEKGNFGYLAWHVVSKEAHLLLWLGVCSCQGLVLSGLLAVLLAVWGLWWWVQE